MNITVRNMEIDPNGNIPQLMFGLFQAGTVRQYISAAKYMIILKPLSLGVPNFHRLTQTEHKVTQWEPAWDGGHVELPMNSPHREGVAWLHYIRRHEVW